MARYMRGEIVKHTRGDKIRECQYIKKLSKHFCKIVNVQGKIEVLPNFEISKGHGNGNGKDGDEDKNTGYAA